MAVATMKDVAALARVSTATVSNYLNKTKGISPATTKRIEDAIVRLEFVPNSASRVMRGRRNQAIGFVVPDAANPFFTEVARGVEDAARAAGCVLVTCNSEGDPDRERQYLTTLAELRVMGVLITPTPQAAAQIASLRRAGTTVVLMDQARESQDISAVAVDDREGGRLAMEHLLSLGHRRILYVSGPGGESQIHARIRGARQALADAGLDPALLETINVNGVSVVARAEVGERILRLASRPTAILCANDLLALAVQATLSRNGVHTPGDVTIVGYDDVDQAQLAAVPLTTIRQPMYQLGHEAATLLLSEAVSGTTEWKQITYTPSLIVRESSAAAVG